MWQRVWDGEVSVNRAYQQVKPPPVKPQDDPPPPPPVKDDPPPPPPPPVKDDPPPPVKDDPPPYRSQTTADEQWYTPSACIYAVRRAMGSIILDPASCDAAQRVVQAERYYTAETDGLAQDWRAATLFINPPFTKQTVDAFAAKLGQAIDDGAVEQAVWLSNNATDTRWFYDLASRADALYLPLGRVKFWQIAKGVTSHSSGMQGQVLLYFGPHAARFLDAMQEWTDGLGWWPDREVDDADAA